MIKVDQINMAVRIVYVVAIVTLLGCSSIKPAHIIPEETWDRLDPYKKGVDRNAVDQLNRICKQKGNRTELINFVNEELDSQFISHEDQVRLSFVVGCLQNTATGEDEKQMISDLIVKGEGFVDYYGLSLSVAPPYIEKSLEVFKQQKRLVGHFVNPDGGGKAKYDIKELFLMDLKYATNRDFGTDYNKWISWWSEEGKMLRFDPKHKEYKYPPKK